MDYDAVNDVNNNNKDKRAVRVVHKHTNAADQKEECAYQRNNAHAIAVEHFACEQTCKCAKHCTRKRYQTTDGC